MTDPPFTITTPAILSLVSAQLFDSCPPHRLLAAPLVPHWCPSNGSLWVPSLPLSLAYLSSPFPLNSLAETTAGRSRILHWRCPALGWDITVRGRLSRLLTLTSLRYLSLESPRRTTRPTNTTDLCKHASEPSHHYKRTPASAHSSNPPSSPALRHQHAPFPCCDGFEIVLHPPHFRQSFSIEPSLTAPATSHYPIPRCRHSLPGGQLRES